MSANESETSPTMPVHAAADDRGASLVEYALLVALIAIACVVAVTLFGTETGDAFSRVGSSVRHT